MSATKLYLVPELIDEDEDSEVAYYLSPYTSEELLALANDAYYARWMAEQDEESRKAQDEEIV